MVFRRFCFAYLVFLLSNVSALADSRSREFAECGFLAHVAVEQMKSAQPRPAVYDDVVQTVVEYAHLYYRAMGQDAPHTGPGISPEMLITIAQVGRTTHARRLAGMSSEISLVLSNRVLEECRLDLQLFAAKERLN